jgi:hypothetical protein
MQCLKFGVVVDPDQVFAVVNKVAAHRLEDMP